MGHEQKKKRNHEADIKNDNKGTEGYNITYLKAIENKEKQLKEARDRKANENNPNNPNYKGLKKGIK